MCVIKIIFSGLGWGSGGRIHWNLQKVAHKNDFGNLAMSLTHSGTTQCICLKRHMAGMAEVRI